MRKFFLIIGCLLFGMNISASNLKTVVYTVTSKTSVFAEGDEPIGSMATFEQTGTGKNGQMTKGNSTTFTLTGLQGLKLYSITLQMRSNQSAGAGSMQIMVGDSVLGCMPDASFEAWCGNYTNSFVPITWEAEGGYNFLSIADGGEGTTLQIQISASENSLYIASYTLVYSAQPTAAYSVHFHTQTAVTLESLTEEKAGGGVILPMCVDADSLWRFKGWTMQTITHTTDVEKVPAIYASGERFYPTEETHLYALYTDNVASNIAQWVQDTVFESGYYLITDSLFQQIAVGEVQSNGKVAAMGVELKETTSDGLLLCPLDDYRADMVYYIEFLPDSMATILHVTSDTYVGYPTTSTANLMGKKTVWNYRITPLKQVIFYHTYATDWRELRVMPKSLTIPFVWELSLSHSPLYANVLFNIADCPVGELSASFTSFPLGTGVEDILAAPVSVLPWGIRNDAGWMMRLYDMRGCQILQTTENILFSHILSGCYLLSIQGKNYKIWVR